VTVPEYPLLLVFIASLIMVFVSGEIGLAIGRRIKNSGGDDISALEAAVLGLLALMISFTFGMALSRYDARRDAVLNEANAIGTTALRARLLPAPYNKEILKELQEYVQIRLAITQYIPSPAESSATISRSNAIQEALWQQVKIVAAKDNAMVPTGIFIQTLNDMIDNQEKRLTELSSRIPIVVLFVLYGIAVIASGFSGYARGLASRPSRLPRFIMGALICVVILMIQDLDRPSAGFITVSQQPMIDAAASLSSYSE
jgi:hypothetical protein